MKALLMWTLSGQNIGWEETFKQAGICLVPPRPLNSTVEVSRLVWCVGDMSYLWNRHWTRDTDENSSGKQWIEHLSSQKPSLRMVLSLPLHEMEKKGFICVGKHSLLYCAIHYYRKRDVSVGQFGVLKIFLLLFFAPSSKGPVAVFRWS